MTVTELIAALAPFPSDPALYVHVWWRRSGGTVYHAVTGDVDSDTDPTKLFLGDGGEGDLRLGTFKEWLSKIDHPATRVVVWQMADSGPHVIDRVELMGDEIPQEGVYEGDVILVSDPPKLAA